MILKHHDINEDEVFFTNVCLCRPEKNADPPKEAIKACSERLYHEVSSRGPDTILALGNFAAKAVLATNTGIMQLRVGPPKQSIIYPDTKIIPTVHPAACLRSADYFPFLVTDVGKVHYKPTVWREPWYFVPSTEWGAIAALMFLQRQKKLAVDIEVAIDKDTAFEHPSQYSILCVGLAYTAHQAVVIPGPLLGNDRVRFALRSCLSHVQIIAQNGKFDLPGLSSVGEFRLTADTMLAHYCLDERGGVHGLKAMSAEYLGAPNYAAEIRQYIRGPDANYGNIPVDILHRYNAYDCTLTYELAELFEQQLQDKGLRELHDFLVEASNALMQVESEGVAIDLAELDQLDGDFAARLYSLERELAQWVANPRSPLQVKASLASRGINTASTDVSNLRAIRESLASYLYDERAKDVDEFLKTLLVYRKEQKLHGTYIKGVRKRLYHGRIYPTYLLHGTTTGRLSCRNPNVQNIPRESRIRNLFVPAAGNRFIQADFKQGELRVIAALSGDQYLIDALAQGRDFLSEIATRFYGDHFTKEQRVKAKNIFYGSSYGAEPLKLTEYTNGSVKEAARFQHELFEMMPNVRTWQRDTRQKVLDGEDLVTTFGRHRRYMLITPENKKDILNECLAFVPQSTLSDICLASLVVLVQRGYHPRITVHDSIVVECAASGILEISEALSDILTRTAAAKFSTAVPFPVDIKVGTSWGDAEAS
jgi:DNA polymerase-1